MSRSIKWILAIVVGLLLVCVVAAAGFFVVSRGNFAAVLTGPRALQFWQGRRTMPMQPFQGLPASRFGRASLLPFIGRWLIFAGLLALVAFGVIALVFLLTRPGQKPAPAVAANAPGMAPAPISTVAAGKNCPNCGRPVQDDWSHCPYCGTGLTESAPPGA
jgi:hypothetical protein